MYPIHLIRHSNPELFFAIAAPVGADVERVCEGLAKALKYFDYNLEVISLIEQLKQIEGYLQNEPTALDEQIWNRMDEGDRFRSETQKDDALAILAIHKILQFREKHDSKDRPIPRQAYLFRSLKRPEEVTSLRRIYGSNLIVIGAHSGREKRVENLAERIANSRFSAQRDRYRDKAEKLIIRDESDESRLHGQRLRKAFPLADVFFDSSNPQAIEGEIKRFLNLLFGKPVVTPTADELGMAHAYTAAMRSSEMGRQVGAAITGKDGNVIAVGTNEVPKAHGGCYSDGDSPDGRDWSRGVDSSDYYKIANLGELLQALSGAKLLREDFNGLPTPEQIEQISPILKQTRYMQLIEFIRAVHAEMSALVDAARRGVSVADSTMYVTTFPCHECARNIVAAGIARVVYIEPYAKSLALELHENSIQLDVDTDSMKIPFMPFLGVSPRNYSNIFEMSERKKDGKVIAWEAATANPRVSGSFWSYLEYEKEDLERLRSLIDKLNSKT
ncbi:MAG: deoxycytidylate deaminase [Acidobacteriia bacterium]|nr:deoxycytidylate deaminase [Terriglobia bacterium]